MVRRYTKNEDKIWQAGHRMVELAVVNRGERQNVSNLALYVDGDPDTLQFVRENLQEVVRNVTLAGLLAVHRPESSGTPPRQRDQASPGLLDRLSPPLKKAFLLMALDRYRHNPQALCAALGISGERLKKEMITCGLLQDMKTA